MVRPAQLLGPLQGDQPTFPAPARRTLRVPPQPRALALASDLRSSLAVHLLDPGRLLAADDPSTSPYAANALLPMSVEINTGSALVLRTSTALKVAIVGPVIGAANRSASMRLPRSAVGTSATARSMVLTV